MVLLPDISVFQHPCPRFFDLYLYISVLIDSLAPYRPPLLRNVAFLELRFNASASCAKVFAFIPCRLAYPELSSPSCWDFVVLAERSRLIGRYRPEPPCEFLRNLFVRVPFNEFPEKFLFFFRVSNVFHFPQSAPLLPSWLHPHIQRQVLPPAQLMQRF